MIVAFYFIVFLLSLVMLGSFLLRNKKVDTLFVLFGILVTINCLGRYMISSADSLEWALWGNKFLYVGGCFAPLLVVFILARLCEHSIPKVLKAFLITYSSVVLLFVMTIGKTGWYYANVELGHIKGFSYLIKTYGPFHALYPVMMLMYGVVMLFYLSYAIRMRNKLSFRLVSTLCVTCFLIIFLYIVERIIGTKISLLSVAYLIGIALLIKYFERLNIYDITSNIISTIEKTNEYGYIVFDDKYRYVNSNSYIKNAFPEINSFYVDREVPKSDSFFYNELIKFLYDWDEKENAKKTITIDDRYFDIEIRIFSYGKMTKAGYLIEFMDRTLENKYYNAIKDYNVILEKEVEQKTANITYIKDMMVLGMADMVESRDNNTGGHIKRTSAVVKIFAEELKNYCDKFKFDNRFLKNVEKAAPMHDLGKIAIDDIVLRKPGKYTPEEFNEMKKHSAEGAKIVVNILQGIEDDDFVMIAKNIANYHHEKWNGQGYPMGLKGEEIPLEARIMALADVFDALVSKRCYKEAFTYDKAFEIIKESLGEHFDPEIGSIFLKCRENFEKLYDNYNSSKMSPT